jgi:hypothetical protein
VLCSGSTLSLVKQSLDEAPYKLSGAIAKLAGITFWSIGFFLNTIKPRFLTEGKFATVLVIPSSGGSQLGGYLPASSIIFWRRCRRKRRLLQGEFHAHPLLCFKFCFTLFLLVSFYQKYKKKLVSFIVVTLLLLVHYFVP